MKEQRFFARCFEMIFICSLALCVLLEFEWDRYFILWCDNWFTGHRSFAINLLIGICSGAFLAFLTARINYLSAKEKFITDFSEMCEDFCAALHKLPYLYFEADTNLWGEYYTEINRLFANSNDSRSHGSAYTKLLDWYKSEYPQGNPEWLLDRRKEEIDNSLNLIPQYYHEFIGFNFCAVERIMKKCSFMRYFVRQEKKVQEIFACVKETYEGIKSKVEYMQEFNDLTNIIIQIDILQARIFDNVQKSKTAAFLPPVNKIENQLKDLLRELNDAREAKKHTKPKL